MGQPKLNSRSEERCVAGDEMHANAKETYPRMVEACVSAKMSEGGERKRREREMEAESGE